MATPHEARPARGLSVSKRAFHVPADNLADAVRLCDPFSPLDPREDEVLHEDLSAIRGGDRLGKIVRNIRRAGGTPTLHFLSGHLGSGKTTELLRMNNRFPDDCNRRSRPTGPRRKLAARDRRALACWRPGQPFQGDFFRDSASSRKVDT